ncbi:MAG: Bax inhibitor-1/YccA family protein [Rickettsiales bacterium]|nr:Bax inhibitor-1/YccA family protein [Rickettsiales bacterium]
MKYANIYSSSGARSYDSGLRDYMYLIYGNMGLSLLISGLVAFLVGKSQILLSIFFSSWPIVIAISLAPMFVIHSMGRNLNLLSSSELRVKLFIVASLMGISIAPIFIIYSGQSIAVTFLTAALTFGTTSLYGYVTKRNLMDLSSFITMGLFGIIGASLINLFLKSSSLDYTISTIGIIVFIVFVAFNVQKLKILYNRYAASNEDIIGKIAVIGALELYLDFVNLFIYLLHFLGKRTRQD